MSEFFVNIGEAGMVFVAIPAHLEFLLLSGIEAIIVVWKVRSL